MIAAVASGFLAAFLAPLVFRLSRRAGPWLMSAVPLTLFGCFLFCGVRPVGDAPFIERVSWIPGLNLDLAFRLDGLSLLFALLITGIGGSIFIYSRGYLAGDRRLPSFYAYMLLFMSSMLGLVLAENVILLYVFWELTTVASFLLIGFDHRETQARRAAVQAFIVTNIGGLALLAGMILMAETAGGYDLTTLLASGEILRAHFHYPAIALLVLLAAFTKSAQIPFHFWLPNAMAAPTPVSAYLHSATMVKGGIYLIARLSPALAPTELWTSVTTIVGGTTLVVCAVMALAQRDLKRMLAYSTASVLGLLVLSLGLGTETAMRGAIVYLFAHALYKATLFLSAGTLDHATGTRDVTKLAGLARVLPLTALAATIAAFSKSGLPPTIGWIGKELIYESALGSAHEGHGGLATAVLIAAVVAGSMFLAAVAWTAGIRPFFGKPKPTPEQPHASPIGMRAATLALGLAAAVFGLFPGLIDSRILQPAAASAAGGPTGLDLALWHGWRPAVGLSLLTIAVAMALFFGAARIRALGRRIGVITRHGPEFLYENSVRGTESAARYITRRSQDTTLRRHLAVVLVSFILLALVLIARDGRFVFVWDWARVENLLLLGLAGLMAGAAIQVTLANSFMSAVISLGVVGYGLAVLFTFLGAPDLALTQVLVETVTLILFVLIVYRLPKLRHLSSTPARIRDGCLAFLAGGIMTAFILIARGGGTDSAVSPFYAAQSYREAHGRNVVNVILVDFRSLDTMGEITVLAVAAFGVLTLTKLALREQRGGQEETPAEPSKESAARERRL